MFLPRIGLNAYLHSSRNHTSTNNAVWPRHALLWALLHIGSTVLRHSTSTRAATDDGSALIASPISRQTAWLIATIDASISRGVTAQPPARHPLLGLLLASYALASSTNCVTVSFVRACTSSRSRIDGETVTISAPALVQSATFFTVRTDAAMISVSPSHKSHQSWMICSTSPPSSSTRPPNRLTYRAPAFAASTSCRYVMQQVTFTSMPALANSCTTRRHDSPRLFVTGTLTAMFGAMPASATPSATIRSTSSVVTSSDKGRSPSRVAISAAASGQTLPSRRMMVGFVVTPSQIPSARYRRTTRTSDVSKNSFIVCSPLTVTT